MSGDYLLFSIIALLIIAVGVLYAKMRNLSHVIRGQKTDQTTKTLTTDETFAIPTAKDKAPASKWDDATAIEISLPEMDEKLLFTKTPIEAFPSQSLYVEVSDNNDGGILSSVVGAAIPITAISKLNPNGLFTATVNPDLLTRFKDLKNLDTLTTMIHGKNGIIAHAGFKETSPKVFQPMALFQIASFVTGQYYLNGITNQLNIVSAKIDKLIAYRKFEKRGRLLQAEKELKELIGKSYPSSEDIIQLKSIRRETGSIKEEYSVEFRHSVENPTNVAASSTHSRAKELVGNALDFTHTCDIISTAEELEYLSIVAELGLRIKIMTAGGGGERQVFELLDTIEKWDKKNLFFAHAETQVKVYFNSVIKKIAELKDSKGFAFYTFLRESVVETVNGITEVFPKDGWSVGKKIRELPQKIPGKRELWDDIRQLEGAGDSLIERIANRKKSSELWDIRNKILNQKAQPVELVYSLDEKTQSTKLFIKQGSVVETNSSGEKDAPKKNKKLQPRKRTS